MLRVNDNPHDRLPARRDQELPAVHDEIPGWALAEREVPIHRAQDLRYSSWIDRDQAWQMLSESARQELLSRAGAEIVDWMAGDHGNGRVWATVLGPAGMCTANPTEPAGSWTYQSWRFVPSSLTRVRIPEATPVTPPAHAQATLPTDDETSLGGSLDQEFRGFLGHLTGSVQQLIQEPYAPGSHLDYFRWYWNEPGTEQTTWRFWCYLTDDVTLTFSSGYKVTNHANADVNWTVWCHRARIV
jgi:hypothetical protein